MNLSKLKLNRSKANVTLATFFFGITFFVLCTFGIDMAFVVLSRYKLQKITDYIALEYASVKMSDMIQNKGESDMAVSCKSVSEKYEKVYNVLGGSGVVNFKIKNMRYKVNSENGNIAVKVQTTSNVLPVFLRFTGIKQIIIHANSYAKSETVSSSQNFPIDSFVSETVTAQSLYEDGFDPAKKLMEFSLPLSETKETGEVRTVDIITSKDTGLGDFQIKYDTGASNIGGGYFIFGGYDDKGWFDMGNLVKDGNSKKVCLNSSKTDLSYTSSNTPEGEKCFYCVNSAKNPTLIFDLSKITNAEQNGISKRINKIKIYQALSSGADNSSNPEEPDYSDPCDPTSIDAYAYYGEHGSSEFKITLTILNNTYRINKQDYDNFTPLDESSSGFCPDKGEESAF